MKQNKYYEVNGCMDFIPVKIEATYSNGAEVSINDGVRQVRVFVNRVCSFEKPIKRQRVLVPKIIAEWYERNKYNLDTAIYGTIAGIYRKVNGENNDLLDTFESWFIHEDNPIFILVQMQLFGYEIEQEKLYTVKIPNPNDAQLMTVLKRLSSGKVIMCTVHRSNIHLFENEEFQLTESEIKEDFAWAWDDEFAKKVDKNDE
ncbi:TPA: DUF1642 domain-containing protein [Streptococcus suis]|uniref:DUF1642 domain-containing protein n=1 Tax=Streptococcus suis TaxID=1307 RepID=UPI000CF5C212|nr:DUF1642 domain-containing protein [Streptococcus suis]HEL2312781.1 DUF1642 domain-containing protein [Streptococcus suis]HEL2505283.1 DUF1642 domain-containing protein [Streptococcus suis]